MGRLTFAFAFLASASASANELSDRVEGLLGVAEAAVGKGDDDAAAGALAAAWIYVGSPLFDEAWDESRSELYERVGVLERQVASLRRYPALTGARALARATLEEAKAQAPRTFPGPYAHAAEAADGCTQAVDELGPEVDRGFAIAGESIDQLRGECAALAEEARLGELAAEEAVEQRVAALRSLVKGERLAVLDDQGEPECDCGDYAPARVAKAKVWTYRRGPEGALSTYVTLTFTFRGDRVTGKHERIAHERP